MARVRRLAAVALSTAVLAGPSWTPHAEADPPKKNRADRSQRIDPLPLPNEFRRIDGAGNHAADLGAADTPLVRLTKIAYANGTDAPAGVGRPQSIRTTGQAIE